jgi:protein phosphatase
MVIVESAGISDIGRKRESNEDCIFMDDSQGLYLVADGMGGHQAGEIASALVVKSIHDFLRDSITTIGGARRRNGCLSIDADRLLAGIEWSNKVVYETAISCNDFSGMGSTVAAVYFPNDTLIAANVGDSPIYLVRNGKIELLSVPHTLQADMAFEVHPSRMANILSRAVGPKGTVEADICELNCFPGDILILCTDGLSTKLAPQEIMSIASTHRHPAQACRRLVDLANKRGGEDNISTVVLRVVSIRNCNSSPLGRWIGRIKKRLTLL